MIVDAQIHVWAAPTPQRPWPADRAQFVHGPRQMSPESVLARMDAAGVDAALLVQPSFEGDRNDLALAAARRYPDRFRVLGRFALDAPDAADVLDAALADPEMVGIRVTVNGRSASWLRDGTLDWLWPFMEDRGVPVCIFPPGQLDEVGRIAAAHPGLRLSVDHLGIPSAARDAELAPIIDALLPLAVHENVAVKASALPAVVTEPFPFPSLVPVLRRVVDAFGPRRVFWGSDLTRLPCSYADAVEFVAPALRDHGPEALEYVLGRGLEEWFNWSLTARRTTAYNGMQ